MPRRWPDGRSIAGDRAQRAFEPHDRKLAPCLLRRVAARLDRRTQRAINHLSDRLARPRGHGGGALDACGEPLQEIGLRRRIRRALILPPPADQRDGETCLCGQRDGHRRVLHLRPEPKARRVVPCPSLCRGRAAAGSWVPSRKKCWIHNGRRRIRGRRARALLRCMPWRQVTCGCNAAPQPVPKLAAMAKTRQYRWRIVRIRAKGSYVGSVEAATADEAIRKAIEEFEITDPEQQKRLIAQREA